MASSGPFPAASVPAGNPLEPAPPATAELRRQRYAAALRPLWRPLRLLAAWTALLWGSILLGSVGWPESLAELLIAAAAFTLGATE